jgi:RNA polymerase sigma factor for flagellar operon FliA
MKKGVYKSSLRPLEERNRMVLENLSVAQTAAKQAFRRFSLAGAICDDVFQVANIGLMDAARTFDPARGVSFGIFAFNRCRGAILDYLREIDFMPRNERKYLKEKADESEEPVHIPTQVFLDAMRNDRGRLNICDPREDPIRIVDARDQVERLIRPLRSINRTVFRMYHLDQMTMHEIGRALGLCETRISQIISESLREIKENLARGKFSEAAA